MSSELIENTKQLLRQSAIPNDIKASYLSILPYLPAKRVENMLEKLQREKILMQHS